jgi:hypothetical protein
VAVLLGGPIFALRELCAIDFGADDICVNAKHAVGLAASHLDRSRWADAEYACQP